MRKRRTDDEDEEDDDLDEEKAESELEKVKGCRSVSCGRGKSNRRGVRESCGSAGRGGRRTRDDGAPGCGSAGGQGLAGVVYAEYDARTAIVFMSVCDGLRQKGRRGNDDGEGPSDFRFDFTVLPVSLK